ncbi:MAG: hypothetical protein GWM90_00730, partial [Gemmatimonadetes bacterium]|nr:hypothetical protein [Gemmatimonadota bacterium]NIQ52063.1 hypothetical protein [Gemmatimonadota bacterium]NIU72163.1 hypothetical protein [Gammaproteobacteria bacterium]NIX42708.1 hypothetical protein [Gemmatimonadota bacterium]NIY06873.1 hypothetical protein [Gemmatimonadota bacterium]
RVGGRPGGRGVGPAGPGPESHGDHHPRSKSMNKSELVQALADKTDTTKADAQRTIEALFSTKDGVL